MQMIKHEKESFHQKCENIRISYITVTEILCNVAWLEELS